MITTTMTTAITMATKTMTVVMTIHSCQSSCSKVTGEPLGSVKALQHQSSLLSLTVACCLCVLTLHGVVALDHRLKALLLLDACVFVAWMMLMCVAFVCGGFRLAQHAQEARQAKKEFLFRQRQKASAVRVVGSQGLAARGSCWRRIVSCVWWLLRCQTRPLHRRQCCAQQNCCVKSPVHQLDPEGKDSNSVPTRVESNEKVSSRARRKWLHRPSLLRNSSGKCSYDVEFNHSDESDGCSRPQKHESENIVTMHHRNSDNETDSSLLRNSDLTKTVYKETAFPRAEYVKGNERGVSEPVNLSKSELPHKTQINVANSKAHHKNHIAVDFTPDITNSMGRVMSASDHETRHPPLPAATALSKTGQGPSLVDVNLSQTLPCTARVCEPHNKTCVTQQEPREHRQNDEHRVPRAKLNPQNVDTKEHKGKKDENRVFEDESLNSEDHPDTDSDWESDWCDVALTSKTGTGREETDSEDTAQNGGKHSRKRHRFLEGRVKIQTDDQSRSCTQTRPQLLARWLPKKLRRHWACSDLIHRESLSSKEPNQKSRRSQNAKRPNVSGHEDPVQAPKTEVESGQMERKESIPASYTEGGHGRVCGSSHGVLLHNCCCGDSLDLTSSVRQQGNTLPLSGRLARLRAWCWGRPASSLDNSGHGSDACASDEEGYMADNEHQDSPSVCERPYPCRTFTPLSSLVSRGHAGTVRPTTPGHIPLQLHVRRLLPALVSCPIARSPYRATERSPHRAGEKPSQRATERSPHCAVERSPSSEMEQSLHYASELSPHRAAKRSPHCAAERSPHRAAERPPHRAPERSPHCAAERSPHCATEESPPSATEGSLHSAAKRSLCPATQRSPPRATERSANRPRSLLHRRGKAVGVEARRDMRHSETTFTLLPDEDPKADRPRCKRARSVPSSQSVHSLQWDSPAEQRSGLSEQDEHTVLRASGVPAAIKHKTNAQLTDYEITSSDGSVTPFSLQTRRLSCSSYGDVHEEFFTSDHVQRRAQIPRGLSRIRRASLLGRVVQGTYALTFVHMFLCLLQLYKAFGRYGVLWSGGAGGGDAGETDTVATLSAWPWLLFQSVCR